MKYNEFEELFSAKRMQKYVAACNNDTRREVSKNLQYSEIMHIFATLIPGSL
jgi:hypothetical protein